MKDADNVLHVAAFVSPAADYYPKEAMDINFGSTRNILRAIEQQGRQDDIKFVYIGTVAETGDRMPPIHWGRVGDPFKPSVYDYYAVSKVAAEQGDWTSKLNFRCAFGHEFEASPRLVLEGGHWCPVCERESWNYQNRAKVDPFFAQVWNPLHDVDEEPRIYKKVVTELDA